jgi:uncharacterized protein (DUF58 family)
VRRPSAGTLALGTALGVAGYLFDAEPLLVAGCGLVLLAIAGEAWVALAARGAQVERALSARRVLEDEPLSVRISARTGAVRWPGGSLTDPLLAGASPLRPLRRRAAARISVRFARRGPRELAPAQLVVRDPLGLAERTRGTGETAKVLVLPRTYPVRAAGGFSGGQSALGSAALVAGASLTEPDGLRPYREGAPAARIHWPALARGAGLLERRLRPEAEARALVVLDTRAPTSEEALDAAVRAAASLVLELGREGGCELLLPGERRPRALEPDLVAWPSLHARLALVGPGPSPATATLGVRIGPVLYVAARALATAPPGAARCAAGRLALVVPAELAGRAPLFAVAGCHGYPATAARRAAA